MHQPSDPIRSAGTRDCTEKVQEEILQTVYGKGRTDGTQVRLSALEMTCGITCPKVRMESQF